MNGFKCVGFYTHSDFGFREQWEKSVSGSSLKDTFKMSLTKLTEILGEPLEGDGYKTTKRGIVQVKDVDDDMSVCLEPNGRYLEIGDWKGSYSEIGEWHVWGNRKEDSLVLHDLISRARTNRLASRALPVPNCYLGADPLIPWRAIDA